MAAEKDKLGLLWMWNHSFFQMVKINKIFLLDFYTLWTILIWLTLNPVPVISFVNLRRLRKWDYTGSQQPNISVKGATRYTAKFMGVSSFYDTESSLYFIKKIINMSWNSALLHKFCRESRCAYEYGTFSLISVAAIKLSQMDLCFTVKGFTLLCLDTFFCLDIQPMKAVKCDFVKKIKN